MNWTVIIVAGMVCLTTFLCVAMIMGSKYPKEIKKYEPIDPSCEWVVDKV